MKMPSLVSVLVILTVFPFRARSGETNTYSVNWPAKGLEGSFTLGFGSALGSYASTSAMGTYYNPYDPSNPIITWTSVRFWSQPDFAQLLFFDKNQADETYYVYPPQIGGRYISWTDADQAWQALLTQGALACISITVVPEPSVAALLGAGLFSWMLFQSGTKRWRQRCTKKSKLSILDCD